MRFCTECGAEISEQANFCKECGSILNQAKEGNQAEANTNSDNHSSVVRTEMDQEIAPIHEGDAVVTNTQAESAVTAPSLPAVGVNQPDSSKTVSVRMSRKQKMFMLAGVLLLVVLFGGYMAGQYFTSEDRLISRLEEALKSKDAKAISELLTSKDEKLKIDEKSITGFMKFLDKNPNENRLIIDFLKEQAKVIDKVEGNQSYEDFYHSSQLDNYINLEKSGKILFFDTYSLTMNGNYLEVETNYAGTVLSVNGQEAAVADVPDYVTKLGPYLPGIYEVEAKFKNEFINLEDKQEIHLFNRNEPYSAYLYLEGETVSWTTRFYGEPDLKGRLFINGKKVEVNPFANPEFGPVTMDGSMTLALEADFPWGTVRSNDIKIDDSYLTIDFTQGEGFQKIIKDTVAGYFKESLDALASGDAGKLTQATDKYKDEFQSFVDEFKESGVAYQSKYSGIILDKGSIRLDYDDGVWEMTLVTQPLIEMAAYLEGDTSALVPQETYSYLELVYDEDQGTWKVDYDAGRSGFETNELEEYKEENPVTYKSNGNEPVDETLKVDI